MLRLFPVPSQHCPLPKSCRFLGVIFGLSAMWQPTALGGSQQREMGRGMGARVGTEGEKGLPTKPKRADGTPANPPTPFRTCHNRTLLDLQAAGGCSSAHSQSLTAALRSCGRSRVPMV